MPNTTATVTLDQTTSPWTLDVAPSDITVSQNALTTHIVWELSGMPAGFAWPGNPTGPKPLSWLSNPGGPPPGTVFGGGQANGANLTVNDAHVGSASNGTFPYQLCVTDGQGNYYYTSNSSSLAAKVGKAPKVTNN